MPHVELIHSVASDSVLRELGRHAPPGFEILVEVNVAGEPGKAGIAPGELDAFIARSPVTVVGLMTMPPATGDPQSSRAHFAALALLARERGLRARCRWAPARISRSRSRRARRSCGSARSSLAGGTVR